MSPIFGLVLSQVPVDLAGVGSGVMSTPQQVGGIGLSRFLPQHCRA